MISLKNKYKGQPIYIIGKGPSLQYLTREMIGEGVVITINDAIAKIEELDIPNDVYAMEKDGYYPNGINSHEPHDCSVHSIMPTRYPVLLHRHESPNCVPDYFHRIIFDNKELGLEITDFSALSAIKLGELMGCDKFYLVSFDACTMGDCNVYGGSNANDEGYKDQCRRMNPLLDNLDYEWITPSK